MVDGPCRGRPSTKVNNMYEKNTQLIIMILYHFCMFNWKTNKHKQPFLRGDHLHTSESDVCRRQILTYKVDPRTEIIKKSNGRTPIT